ncbi:MAG: hypothetical protein RIQ81_1945 [Pseudomonadota bacterium]|jgi:tetratricopeptide (TPR) repeat protein
MNPCHDTVALLMPRRALLALLALVASAIFLPTPALAADFSEIVLSFPEVRPYSAKYDAVENSVRIELLKTSSEELAALERYDEDLVRRVVVKDRAADGVEILIKLKSREVVATVEDFREPFRIVIDIFKRGYSPARDAEGLPRTKPAEVASAPDNAPSAVSAAPSLSANAAKPLPATPVQGDSASVALSAKNPPQRRIFQQAPRRFEGGADLCAALNQAKPGTGTHWSKYADPVYRLDFPPAKSSLAAEIPQDVCNKAITSTKDLSLFAKRLFDDGQEFRAMSVYQQLLFHDPQAIEQDAGNLWRMAEIHLGQGNLSLAGGYYETISKRFPGTQEAFKAAMRSLDVNSLELIQAGNQSGLAGGPVEKIASLEMGQGDSPTSVEIRAGKVLRASYWRNASSGPGKLQVADLSETESRELEALLPKIQHPRTKFLTASLLLAGRVAPARAWEQESGVFAANYFRDYKTAEWDPMRGEMLQRLRDKLDSTLQSYSAAGRHVEAVQTFELLPKPLQSVRKNTRTAWAMGESYRNIGQPQPAVAFYEAAAKDASGIDRFKAQFWMAQMASETSDVLGRMKAGATRISPYQRQVAESDRGMAATLAGLNPSEREQLYSTFRGPLESSIEKPTRLRTPPRFVLSAWRDNLSSRRSASTDSAPVTDLKSQFAPGAASAKLVSGLAARFKELGMSNERRQALALLKEMKPSQFGDDTAARKAWMDQLLGLAEEYRKDNEYLESGRIFSLVASESENWEGRAETLYKAGLLLYRAGRKDEAIAALEKAKADGNNLFYANLATERLSQIQKK